MSSDSPSVPMAMGERKRAVERAELAELREAVSDFAFALEVICSRIPSDARHLSGHESTAYQALVKHPEIVRSLRVRELMGLEAQDPIGDQALGGVAA